MDKHKWKGQPQILILRLFEYCKMFNTFTTTAPHFAQFECFNINLWKKKDNEVCENKLCASARIKQGLRYGFKQWKIPNLFENVDL